MKDLKIDNVCEMDANKTTHHYCARASCSSDFSSLDPIGPDFSDIKRWLDYLYYEIGNQQFDFELQILTKEWASKRKKYSEVCFDCDNAKNADFLDKVNQRQIFPNEIVLDIENKEKYSELYDTLKKLGLIFYAFDTGSRGFHIHIFMDKAQNPSERLKLIKRLGADEQLNSPSHMIALEFAKHWKSGMMKKPIGAYYA